MAGALVLAGTPIGCVDDASPRLVAELMRADVIAAEDTRRIRRLAADLDLTLTARIVSYFEGNEVARTPGLIRAVEDGERVLLVTDAGMPTVSDPGYRLVAAAVAADLPITVVPGPSAVLVALALSGLPVDRFCFEGFPARKGGERRRGLSDLAREPRTMVFFESPHRITQTLQDMVEAFGADRPAAVCRELTKTHEEAKRGTLAELAAWSEPGVRGEITVVVAGYVAPERGDAPVAAEDVAELVEQAVESGLDRRAALQEAARRLGISRREAYDLLHRV